MYIMYNIINFMKKIYSLCKLGLKFILLKKHRFFYFPLLVILIYFFLVIARIHGSSIGIYNTLLYGETKDSNLIFSELRSIRSDEWLGSSTYTVSQYYNNYERKNFFIGEGQEMSLLFDVPTKHWTTIFKPYTLGFFLGLPLENAFVFKWWFNSVLVILAFYTLFFQFSRNAFVSALFSLSIYFIPFHQWWSINGLLGYFAVTTSGLIVLVREHRWWVYLLTSLVIIYSSMAFILILYPPFQILLIYLSAIIVLGYSLHNRSSFYSSKRLQLSILLGSIGMVTVLLLALLYQDFKDIIQLITNTVYPGDRFFMGGTYDPVLFMQGFFNSQLQKLSTMPQIMVNHSEASSYFMLFPFYIPLIVSLSYFVFLKTGKLNYYILLLSGWMIIGVIYLFIGFSELVAKATLFYLIAEKRVILGIGLANMLCMFFILYWKELATIPHRRFLGLITGAYTAFSIVLIGRYYQLYVPGYIVEPSIIYTMAVAFGVLLYLLITQNKILFVLLLFAISFYSSYRVTPLYKGLSPLNSELIREIKTIEDAYSQKTKWMVYNHGAWGNYLIANGITSINGIHVYPHFSIWNTFDPSGKFNPIYNRYANVMFGKSSFEMISFPVPTQYDSFVVQIHPCRPELKKLGVTHFLSYSEALDGECLKELKEFDYPTGKLFLYQRL